MSPYKGVPPRGVISRLHSLIIVRFKICTVNVTKSGTIRYLAYYPLHGGQTLPKKDGERKKLGMRDILRKWGNVKAEDVKGYRAPYIQVGVNMEFKVLKD